MTRRRVVITGMGMVTPLGNDVETVWKRLLNGDSGICYNTLFDASTFPTQFVAQVPEYDYLQDIPESIRSKFENVGRNSRFIISAALNAWKQAGLAAPSAAEQPVNADRMGVYLGAGEGPVDFENFIAPIVKGWNDDKNDMDWEEWTRVAKERFNPKTELEQEPNIPSSHVARLFKLQGPCFSCLTACAASTQAIGEATELIRHGEADLIVTGGCHSMIHPLGLTGFNRLTALSTRNDDIKTSSRPFDKDRDGFVLAEGAGAIIIEDYDSAVKRGATILAEIIGYGTSADAFRVTDQHEDGRGGSAAVKMALDDAQVTPEQIQYISAHGTSTSENDSIETKVIKNTFGDQAYKTPVSSVKSMLGHLIAAAGVVELITCVLSMRDNILPPTMNLQNPDPECDLDYVPNAARPAEVNIAMSNSFGFGGQNDTVIIKQP